jgi:predicted deacylase
MAGRSELPQPVANSRIYTSMDLMSPGKREGHFFMPFASNDAAEKRIGVPLGVIANGTSPTVILMAGTHGDEYESQLVVRELFQSIDYKKIKGRIIFIPASNLPAVKNGTRFSPFDQGNLNGSFINEPTKGPTYSIAHYIENALFPMADLVMDLHAGGKTLSYIPGVHIPLDDDPERMKRLCELAITFNSAAKYIFDFKGNHSMFAAGKRQGTYVMGGELGGGLNPINKGMKIGKAGVLNVLGKMGILPPPKTLPANDQIDGKQNFLLIRGPGIYGFAREDGLFAHAQPIGAPVQKGQLAGKMHDLSLSKPVKYFFESDGVLVCRRAVTLSQNGDCLWHLARPVAVEAGSIVDNLPPISYLRHSYG